MYRTCAFYDKRTGKYLGFCADREPFFIDNIDADVTVRKYASTYRFPEKEQRIFIGESSAHLKNTRGE